MENIRFSSFKDENGKEEMAIIFPNAVNEGKDDAFIIMKEGKWMFSPGLEETHGYQMPVGGIEAVQAALKSMSKPMKDGLETMEKRMTTFRDTIQSDMLDSFEGFKSTMMLDLEDRMNSFSVSPETFELFKNSIPGVNELETLPTKFNDIEERFSSFSETMDTLNTELKENAIKIDETKLELSKKIITIGKSLEDKISAIDLAGLEVDIKNDILNLKADQETLLNEFNKFKQDVSELTKTLNSVVTSLGSLKNINFFD